MNEIQLFNNPEFGEIRSVIVDGEPWFVLKDICAAFGERNYRRVTSRLDDDEKGVSQIATHGGTQDMTVVNESGIYSALFAMQPEKARGVSAEYVEERIKMLKSFKHWVTSEVLPQIRQTGSYSIAARSEPSDSDLKLLSIRDRESRTHNASIFLSIMEHLDTKSESYRQILMACAANTAAGQIVLPLPKCEFANTYSASDIGKMFGISSNMVGRIANKNGIKSDKFGEFYHDVSSRGKECDVFRYNDAAVKWFSDYLNAEPTK